MTDVLLGILLGSITGLLLSLITVIDQYPSWKKQGFSRAKNPEEHQIVKNYYSENRGKIKLYLNKYAVPLIAIAILLSGILISKNLMLYGSFSIAITFLVGIFFIASLLDPFIRKSVTK